MERETINYNGKNYHRYPESERAQHRNYYYMHDKNNATPVALHRKIWEDHNGPIPKGMEVHHKDGNFSNNSISNLEVLSSGDHRRKHPASEETRQKFSENTKKRQPLKKWREENPVLAKEYAIKNGSQSKGLENWRKENPDLVHQRAVEAGRKSAEINKERGFNTKSLDKWRKENPELAKQMSIENGSKSQSLANWRKENPKSNAEALAAWRKNNPELAKQHASANGKKGAETRARKKASLQSNGG